MLESEKRGGWGQGEDGWDTGVGVGGKGAGGGVGRKRRADKVLGSGMKEGAGVGGRGGWKWGTPEEGGVMRVVEGEGGGRCLF